jgi:hypothetical protein
MAHNTSNFSLYQTIYCTNELSIPARSTRVPTLVPTLANICIFYLYETLYIVSSFSSHLRTFSQWIESFRLHLRRLLNTKQIRTFFPYKSSNKNSMAWVASLKCLFYWLNSLWQQRHCMFYWLISLDQS